MRLKSINLLVLVTVPFTLWLGFTSQVDWVVLGFIWLMSMGIHLPIKLPHVTKREINFWEKNNG